MQVFYKGFYIIFSNVKGLRAQIKSENHTAGKYQGNSSIRSQPIPFKSFPIHHLPIILIYNAV
jgi:hypothetical protein